MMGIGNGCNYLHYLTLHYFFRIHTLGKHNHELSAAKTANCEMHSKVNSPKPWHGNTTSAFHYFGHFIPFGLYKAPVLGGIYEWPAGVAKFTAVREDLSRARSNALFSCLL